MAERPNFIDLNDLRGGVADGHPSTLAMNQVAAAWDVDYYKANVCGRRNGTSAVASGLASVYYGLFHHRTQNSYAANDLLFQVADSGAWSYRNVAGVLTNVTPAPADTFTPWVGVDAVSLHGKLFIACKSNVDRMHVWDGATLRRLGFTTSIAAPTGADSGGAGTYTGTRYARVRFVTQSGGATILRSEPGAVLTVTPSGANASYTFTRPAAPGEHETHWEIELSDDNVDFYRVSTIALATTTYVDSAAAIDYATNGTLSEDIGDYTPPHSARWVTTDNDRLIVAGGFEGTTYADRVSWSPTSAQLGVGNAERLPTDTNNYVRIGRDITGCKAFEGKIVVFALDEIHVFVRAGINGQAYLPGGVIRSRGALPYSICEGVDDQGRPTLYFLDPATGPSAMGANGIVTLAPHLLKTWRNTIDVNASRRAAHAVFYPNKRQVWFYINDGSGAVPKVKWVYHTESGGITFHTLPVSVNCSVIWQDFPHIGDNASQLAKCDDPAATTDTGTHFRGYIKTRAYPLRSYIDLGGVTGGILETDPLSGVSLTVSIVRDYGKETGTFTGLMTPVGSEEVVLVQMDDAVMSEASVVQFEIGDASARSVAAWQLHRAVFPTRTEGRQV